MKRTLVSLAFSAIATLGTGAALAANTITGLMPNPSPSTEGADVAFKINATGGECFVRLVYGNGEPSDNMKINTQGPNSGGILHKTFQKKGTYSVQAIGSPSSSPACTGQATATLVVNAKPTPPQPPVGQMQMPVVAAAPVLQMWDYSCPAGFEKVFENKPEIKCRKLPVACPPHFDGSVDSNTGDLVCTPKPATCPDGWQGAMQGGVLKCTSKPQPMLACPKGATPEWKWGTTYYKEGWRFMGCVKNLEPPK